MQSKQKTLQVSYLFRNVHILRCALCVFGISGAVTTARTQNMLPGSGEQMSTVRLIAAAGLRDGRYEAGVGLAMTPGSHTYWKVPGEAGVPPVFTFNGSENVRSADVEFPAPVRITEDGLDTYGYLKDVVFPVVVKPIDPAKPSTLHVDVTYAVCNKICLPGHGEASLELKPHGSGLSADLVTTALAAVPRSAGHVDDLRVTRDKDQKTPTWTLTWTGPKPLRDIFSDAPAGFYFQTKKTGAGVWSLTAEQSVSAPKATTVPVTLVLAGDEQAIEITQTFDIGPAGK